MKKQSESEILKVQIDKKEKNEIGMNGLWKEIGKKTVILEIMTQLQSTQGKRKY